jgi:predicted MPP superfamily phosphohydrolase
VCVTGDLLSRPRGERQLLALFARLPHPYVVLGNHDHAISRDPFSRPVELGRLEHGTMLVDSAVEVGLRGRRVELAGVDPRTWLAKRASNFAPSDADLRILLCHFPRALDTVEPGRWNLILAGHLHAGQIVLPYGFGRLLLAHPRAKYRRRLRGAAATDALPGLGTTFTCRSDSSPAEATELVSSLF